MRRTVLITMFILATTLPGASEQSPDSANSERAAAEVSTIRQTMMEMRQSQASARLTILGAIRDEHRVAIANVVGLHAIALNPDESVTVATIDRILGPDEKQKITTAQTELNRRMSAAQAQMMAAMEASATPEDLAAIRAGYTLRARMPGIRPIESIDPGAIILHLAIDGSARSALGTGQILNLTH